MIALLAMFWLVIGALLQERLPNELNPKEGYIFDYIVGEFNVNTVVHSMQKSD